MIPLEENDVKKFQTYSECCSSDTIMKWIKWFLELTNHPFTWNDLTEHIMDKLGVQIKPHIIRRLLRDRFTKRYLKGSWCQRRLILKSIDGLELYFEQNY